MKVKSVFLVVLIYFINFNLDAQSTWTSQAYNPNVFGIEKNPMKGFVPGYNGINSTFPYSVDHFYIPLNTTFLNWNTYDWSTFESELNRVTSKGCHAIVRFFIDYPNRSYAMPAFLQNVVPAYDYTSPTNSPDKSKAPDWNDNILMTALEQFIAAFGARYDNDPRILFVEAGLYGFWGEWHTTGHATWEMNQVNKNRLLTAYNNAFVKTHVGLRQASHAGTTELASKVGYYDDSFCYFTLCTSNWCYWQNMINKNITDNYLTHPMGGELRPELQNNIFDVWPNATFSTEDNMNMEDLQTCVNTTHPSFMKAFYLYQQQPTATQYTNALKIHKMMGYQLYVSEVQIVPESSNSFTLNLKLQNKGVAPLYYNWQVEISAINSAGQWIGVIGTADWNITSVLPNSTDYLKTFTGNLPAAGRYKILMRLKNPLESYTSNARALYFANAKQNFDRLGWLTLGTVDVLTGIDNLIDVYGDKTNAGIRVFPNPPTDVINIESEKSVIEEVAVYAMNGQLLFSKPVNSASVQLNADDLKKNNKMVLLRVITDNNTTMMKLLMK